MTASDSTHSGPEFSAEDTKHMSDHGITYVRVDNFRVGGYRYTNLKDAIHQAQRMETKNRTPN